MFSHGRTRTRRRNNPHLASIRRNDPTGQVRTGQVRTGQVKTGQVRTGQVRAGQVRSGRVRTGQVKTDQVGTGQVKSGLVRTNIFYYLYLLSTIAYTMQPQHKVAES